MKTALLIDGGYLRACTKNAGHTYDLSFIEAFARRCIDQSEYLLRVLYYDSPQFRGTVRLPVSGNDTSFQSNDRWLRDLAKLERFAVRRGAIGFRGWKPKTVPISGASLTDSDFVPVFEQKGVDMRIGLDVANFSERRVVDRIVMVSGDTDMIPAMKQARKAGLEVALIQLPAPTLALHDSLLEHCDFIRAVTWS
jgi:uncharacterized LabA/DUF88 family protein